MEIDEFISKLHVEAEEFRNRHIAAQEEGILSDEDLNRDEGAWLGSFFLWWSSKHPDIE